MSSATPKNDRGLLDDGFGELRDGVRSQTRPNPLADFARIPTALATGQYFATAMIRTVPDAQREAVGDAR
jgi:hypothetical protein